MTLPPGRWVGQGEWEFRCMECPSTKPAKAYFNTDKGVGICHRCKRIYFWRDFSGDFVPMAQMLAPKQAPKKWTQSDDLCSVYDAPEAQQYLAHRRVPQRHWVHLSYLPSTNELYLPIYSIDGGPPSYTRRTVGQKGWRVIGGLSNDDYVFFLSETLPMRKALVLVEGPFDVLVPDWPDDLFAFALLGTNLSKQKLAWLILQDCPILVWMDPDAAGRKAAVSIASRLLNHGACAHLISHVREPGDCTPSEAHEVARHVLVHC